MTAPSVTNTFANGTTADATAVNQNFTDLISAMTDGSKSFSIDALTCAGAATFNGAVSLGNATGDDITVTGYVASDILPKNDAQHDLGSASKQWCDLYTKGTTSLDGAVTINESGAAVDFRVEGDTDANLLVCDASADRVGIGTDTPGYKLHTKAATVRFEAVSAGKALDVVNDSTKSYIDTTHGLQFRTNGASSITDAMFIDTTQKVGIGTTSPTNLLTVSANTDAFYSASFTNANTSGAAVLIVGTATSTATPLGVYDGTNSLLVVSGTGVVTMYGLSGSGSRTVTAGATGILAASSDIALKQVVDAKIPGLKEVLELKPTAYKWKEDIKIRGELAAVEIGFIANEVAPIIPSAAPKGHDGLFGFYDRSVIAALVKAIQEQQAQIEEIKRKIA
jgi:hypothetical protein